MSGNSRNGKSGVGTGSGTGSDTEVALLGARGGGPHLPTGWYNTPIQVVLEEAHTYLQVGTKLPSRWHLRRPTLTYRLVQHSHPGGTGGGPHLPTGWYNTPIQVVPEEAHTYLQVGTTLPSRWRSRRPTLTYRLCCNISRNGHTFQNRILASFHLVK